VFGEINDGHRSKAIGNAPQNRVKTTILGDKIWKGIPDESGLKLCVQKHLVPSI
jgi:hypothetical protein